MCLFFIHYDKFRQTNIQTHKSLGAHDTYLELILSQVHTFVALIGCFLELSKFWKSERIFGQNGQCVSRQTMTEAAFFTIGQSRTIGYGKIRPLADYRSRSRLLIFFLIFLTFILFIDSSSSINSFNQFLTRPCENWTLIILTHLIFQKFNPLGVGSLGD